MPRFKTASWPDNGKIGQEVALSCTFATLKKEATVVFEIYEYSGRSPKNLIIQIPKNLKKDATGASVMWQIVHVDEEDLSRNFPEYIFTVRFPGTSYSKSSNVLDIGRIESLSVQNLPGSKTPKPPVQGEVDCQFIRKEQIELSVSGQGLKNYVYDFYVFHRIRERDNSLSYTLLQLIPDVIPQSDTQVSCIWTLANIKNGEQYYGEKFTFSVGFRPPGQAPKMLNRPPMGYPVQVFRCIEGVLLNLENSQEKIVAGQDLKYTIKVIGADKDYPVLLYSELAQSYSRLRIDEPICERITEPEKKIDVSIPTVVRASEKTGEFKIKAYQADTNKELAELSVPVEIKKAFVKVSVPALNPQYMQNFFDALFQTGVAIFDAEVDYTPGMKLNFFIENRDELSFNAGFSSDSYFQIDDPLPPAKRGFDFKLNGPGLIPIKNGEIILKAEYMESLNSTFSIPFEILELIKGNIKANFSYVRYRPSEMTIEYSTLSRISSLSFNLKILVFVNNVMVPQEEYFEYLNVEPPIIRLSNQQPELVRIRFKSVLGNNETIQNVRFQFVTADFSNPDIRVYYFPSGGVTTFRLDINPDYLGGPTIEEK